MNDPAALDESRRLPVRSVTLVAPWRWLQAGWRDFERNPGPGIVHGAALALFGALLFVVAYDRFWLLAGAFSGFLLMAPLLATGLYAISRGLESGRRVDVRTALRAWAPNNRRLVAFGVLLGLAGTGWVLTSAALIQVFAPAPVRNPQDFLRVVVLAPDSLLFQGWMMFGGLLAAPVFASTVVAIPLLLDRPVGVLAAVLTSWRAVMANPLPLALWAALLLTMTAVGMVFAMLGLLVVVPWLGHASWHAYRDLVDVSALPETR
jgi:uncharacterized membrane protein